MEITETEATPGDGLRRPEWRGWRKGSMQSWTATTRVAGMKKGVDAGWTSPEGDRAGEKGRGRSAHQLAIRGRKERDAEVMQTEEEGYLADALDVSRGDGESLVNRDPPDGDKTPDNSAARPSGVPL